MSSGPQRIGPCIVEGVIGAGGAGVVFRGRSMSGERVAIKRLHSDDEELAARLLREAEVRVSHPNVVRYLASGIDSDGQPYIVSELLEGESLRARMRRGIDPRELVRLMTQAARGLAALHEAGIVHRDLKPDNMFVTREGVLKILDFGTASFAESHTALTATGALMGTPAYLSPEQTRGERALDLRTDLWSLGVTLYEGLLGEPPFFRSTIAATALAIQQDPLPSPFAGSPDLPLELGLLIERCLARRVADRPSSAAEVAEVLESIAFDAPARVSHPMVPRAEQTWRNVALVLFDDVAERGELEEAARALDGTLFPLFARSAVVLFGADTSHGDELARAVELALKARDGCRISAVTDGRARAGGREIDPETLETAMRLIEGAPGGVVLSAHAAALCDRSLGLRQFPDGTALLLGDGAGELPGLVGREAELRRLRELAERARAGDATSVAIVGEAGIGKTALVRGFLATLEATGASSSSIVAHAGRGPTAPLGALLRALDVDPPPEDRDPQRALDRRRLSVLDRLGELLAQNELVVLVIEGSIDADRADPHLAALAQELPTLFADRPLLIVTTRRGEPTAGDIALGPLDTLAIAALIERELGAVPPGVAAEVTARSEGNPLFAEHLVRLARALGVPADVASWNLPLTVESAVQAQLDELGEDLRAAVHGLAVLGVEAELTPTRLALGADADRLLTRLAARGVIELDARPPSWRFESRLVAEVAYQALDPSEAERLHRSVAERLARDPSVDPELALRHADRGGVPELASRFAKLAFVRAAHTGDGRRALELYTRLERGGEADFTAHFLAAEAAAFVVTDLRVEDLLKRALDVAATGDERGAVLAELGERARRAGRLTEARELLARARAETTDAPIAVRALAREALVLVSEQRATDAVGLLDETHDTLPPSVRALVWDTRGYVQGALGALGPRRHAYERAADLYAEAGDARRAAGANANLGDTMRQMGDLAVAEATLRRAAEGARRLGNGLTEAYASANLASALIAAGRTREAQAVLDVADARAAAVLDARLALVTRIYRARAEGRSPSATDLDDARARDRTVLALALACHLEHGAPSASELDEAADLFGRASEIEEGALELGLGLSRHRPSAELAALIDAHLLAIHRSIGEPEWQRTFARYVGRTLGGLAAGFLAEVSPDA